MEYIFRKLLNLVLLLIFIAFVALVVIGQKDISYHGFGIMMIGVAGIILCLFIYNKKNN